MDLKLCDSDYRFMMVVWENEPVKSTELAKLCAVELGWKKSTVFSAIKKLCQKGFLQNSDAVVSSLVSRDECQRAETAYFIDKTFKGSVPDFISAFLQSKRLAEGELDEIKAMLDKYRESE